MRKGMHQIIGQNKSGSCTDTGKPVSTGRTGAGTSENHTNMAIVDSRCNYRQKKINCTYCEI